jgi:hypothetical protein
MLCKKLVVCTSSVICGRVVCVSWSSALIWSVSILTQVGNTKSFEKFFFAVVSCLCSV